jgi:hypothetical protein
VKINQEDLKEEAGEGSEDVVAHARESVCN